MGQEVQTGRDNRAKLVMRWPWLTRLYEVTGLITSNEPDKSVELRRVEKKSQPQKPENAHEKYQRGETLKQYRAADAELAQIQTLELPDLYGGVAIHVAKTEAKSGHESEPPIVFLPGASNHPDDVRSLTLQLATQTGRQIIVLGYPDEITAKCTSEFHDAVMADTDFSCKPHLDIVRAALKKTLGETNDKKFDLMGYSAGGILTMRFMQDPKIQGNIRNAVIINAAGTNREAGPPDSSIEALKFMAAFFNEIPNTYLRFLAEAPNYSYAIDTQEKTTVDGRIKNEIYAYWINSARRDVIDLTHLPKTSGIVTLVGYRNDLITGFGKSVERTAGLSQTFFKKMLRPGGHGGGLFESENLVRDLLSENCLN